MLKRAAGLTRGTPTKIKYELLQEKDVHPYFQGGADVIIYESNNLVVKKALFKNQPVVVKTFAGLKASDKGGESPSSRSFDALFEEAKILRELDHPQIAGKVILV